MLWTAMSSERSCNDTPAEPITRGRRRLPDDRGWLVLVPSKVGYRQSIKATFQRLKLEAELANADFAAHVRNRDVADEFYGGW
jgi:hypothetical protein